MCIYIYAAVNVYTCVYYNNIYIYICMSAFHEAVSLGEVTCLQVCAYVVVYVCVYVVLYEHVVCVHIYLYIVIKYTYTYYYKTRLCIVINVCL